MTPGLPKRLQPALKRLAADLLDRAREPGAEAGLRAAWTAEQKAGQTGQGFDPWRRERVTQIAVAWVLSVVFVRTLEDRRLIDPRIAGPGPDGREAAADRERQMAQLAPFLGPREYLLTVFRELSRLPGSREVFDARHNPVWVLSPSSEGARALLDFFQSQDLSFEGTDTRFLGDLYQDLSEDIRDRYALLQTPEFVEEFILSQTLDPAVEEFGLAEVKLLDPTCGSGHFLIGAFRSLLKRWRAARPTEEIADLARRALEQVYGVDINPYAVAIARFRLVLEVLGAVGVARLDRAPEIKVGVVVADSLLHRFGAEQLRFSGVTGDFEGWGDGLYRLEEPAEVERVLRMRYQAVVGNPPYITEKDGAKRKKFIEMYTSAAAQFALAAPFTERFFELAQVGGFVGLINANSFMKRDFGKSLIEVVLRGLDVTEIVDTSGCYIPGHGTPTLLLFGRNRPPTGELTVATLGKRGEREEPADAAQAPAWMEITAHHREVGFDGEYVSVETMSPTEVASHPWVLHGGGARELKARIDAGQPTLSSILDDIGYSAIIGEDEAFMRPRHAVHNLPNVALVVGDAVRDWECNDGELLLRPFRQTDLQVDASTELQQHLWTWKRVLEERIVSGSMSMKAAGRKWYDLRRLSRSKHTTPLSIVFPFVGTHNHFVLDHGGRLFKQTAPIIKLFPKYTEADHQALLGYLNSSTTAFWCRLVMFPKGGDQVGDGARLSRTPWQDRLEYAGNLLQQLPVPDLARLREALLDLVIAAEDTVRQLGEASPLQTLTRALTTTPTLGTLRTAREAMLTERARLRGILISLQEEMDWRVYGVFGLPTVTAPSLAAVAVPVAPEHRPFEVRLARDVASDVSASEWFRIHHRAPPADVGGPLAELYRQRLRLLDHPEHGKDLRLLETPETKRRWSPPDDAGAFLDAARGWLLDRIEALFRSQPQPELMTARQVALELGRDAAALAVHELLTEATGQDLRRLVAELLDQDGVPFLAALRYTETGLEKRAAWEKTWDLQRAEDAGRLAEALAAQKLSAIPVPDKYASADFQRHYWGLRGALDVPKERFITVPVGSTDDDPSLLVGWAGWDHLQQAQALAALIQRRKDEDGWDRPRLLPLLAGLDERVPWLLQWHDEPSEHFGGLRLGGFFKDFVGSQAHALGASLNDLRAWRPEPTVGRGRKKGTAARGARGAASTPGRAAAAPREVRTAPPDEKADEDEGPVAPHTPQAPQFTPLHEIATAGSIDMAESLATSDAPVADSKSRRLTLALSSLYLDPNNYRFIDHENYRPVPEDKVFEDEHQRRTRLFILGEGTSNVDDLIASFTQNGWLDVEPIHVKRVTERRYLVVEGNRRVSTLKYLYDRYTNGTGQIGKLDPNLFKSVPCVLYEEKDEVHQLVIMGLHHISGKKRWPAINQARLMRKLRDDYKQPADEVCRSLGVSKREFNLSLRTLSLCEAYRKSDYGDQFGSEMFNLFREILKAPSLRTWIEWDDASERARNRQNLDRLFSWVSRETEPDEDDEEPDARSRTADPIITTGAQVRELARIIEDKDAVKRLEETRSLQAASLTSDLLVRNELDGALERCSQDVNRLFNLAPRMQPAMLDRVDQLVSRLQGVALARRRQPVGRASERPWQPYTEVPKVHFQSLQIERFRGLQAFSLVGLGRINLLVGINNAGKTSILESLYLLVHQSDPRGLLETIRRRTREDGEAMPSWLVDQLPAPVALAGVFDTVQNNTARVQMLLASEPESPDEDWTTYLRSLEIDASYAGRTQRTVTDFFEGRPRRTTLEGDPRWLCPSVLHSPFSMSDPETLTRCNRASLESGTKEKVLTFIREHLDPGLKSIELVDRHRFVVTHEHYEGARDLAYFGEGLQRVFQIGLLFAGARGGVVLIDEFENALHTNVLLVFSRFVQQLAVEFDVQVFLTTHSKETVDAFVLNDYRNEDVVAFGLSRKNNSLVVRRYEGTSLRLSIEAVDIDIRSL